MNQQLLNEPIADITDLKVFCKDETCGDPVAGRNGDIKYTHRQMSYAGKSLLADAVYRCPVCEKKRTFKLNRFSQQITER